MYNIHIYAKLPKSSDTTLCYKLDSNRSNKMCTPCSVECLFVKIFGKGAQQKVQISDAMIRFHFIGHMSFTGRHMTIIFDN